MGIPTGERAVVAVDNDTVGVVYAVMSTAERQCSSYVFVVVSHDTGRNHHPGRPGRHGVVIM